MNTMPPIELVAALLGLANLVLLARRSVWNFPFGLAMVSLYAWVYLDARLLSAVLLQGFFLATQAWGWWQWRVVAVADVVPVRRLPVPARWLAAVGTVVLALTLGFLTSRFTDAAAPFLDATNTSLSMTAQILTMVRRIEAWPLWIVVNLLSLVLYSSQGLWITTGLYGVFLLISVWSWFAWRRAA